MAIDGIQHEYFRFLYYEQQVRIAQYLETSWSSQSDNLSLPFSPPLLGSVPTNLPVPRCDSTYSDVHNRKRWTDFSIERILSKEKNTSDCISSPQVTVADTPFSTNPFSATTIHGSKGRRYLCGFCGRDFSRTNTLKTHQRIHTGEKPFKCEECGRSFRQEGNLKRHFATHSNQRAYECHVCHRRFNRATNLRTHQLSHGTT